MSEETAVDVLNIKCCLEVRRRQSGHYFGILCVIERERRTLRDKGRNTQRVITGVEEDKKRKRNLHNKSQGKFVRTLIEFERIDGQVISCCADRRERWRRKARAIKLNCHRKNFFLFQSPSDIIEFCN